MKYLIVAAIVTIAGSGMTANAEPLADCPNFKPSYNTCEKTGGVQPPFFASVRISKRANGYDFVTDTVQGPMPTEYTPDRVVRLGSDYHTLSDGTLLPDLPAHESSYCDAGTLYRSEVTFLPDNTFVQETLELTTTADGALNFKLAVNDDMKLTATCTAE